MVRTASTFASLAPIGIGLDQGNDGNTSTKKIVGRIFTFTPFFGCEKADIKICSPGLKLDYWVCKRIGNDAELSEAGKGDGRSADAGWSFFDGQKKLEFLHISA